MSPIITNKVETPKIGDKTISEIRAATIRTKSEMVAKNLAEKIMTRLLMSFTVLLMIFPELFESKKAMWKFCNKS